MSADFSERRVKMVDGQVRTTDVTSAPLIEAMLSVPREAFVGAGQQDLAYIDEDIRISDGANGGGARYLMEPSPLAKLLQLAEIAKSDVSWRSAAAPATRPHCCHRLQVRSLRSKAMKASPPPRRKRCLASATTTSPS